MITIVLAACSKEPATESSPEVRVDVKTAVVRVGGIDETILATGSTAIQREAQLRSPITGILVGFRFFNGDKIEKGVSIAQVRTRESQASIQGAEELLRSARTDQQRDEAQRALRLANETANTVQIKAPFDGLLSAKTKNEMEVVAEGDQVATLVDPSSVFFLAEVPSASLHRIHTGQIASVRFTSKPGRAYQGTVQRIEPQMNAGDQTARVHITFGTQAPVLEGSLFGEAAIVVGRKEHVLLVPAAALLRDDENNRMSVMLLGPDSVAHMVEVIVGLKRDSVAEISSPGITAGSTVITEGSYGLPDSTRVRVVH
jgi:multidrug efflux pump subunit AcrA (membrane-fusion protein)